MVLRRFLIRFIFAQHRDGSVGFAGTFSEAAAIMKGIGPSPDSESCADYLLCCGADR
jgi:hypothetical protein